MQITARTMSMIPEERWMAGAVAMDRGVSIGSLVRDPLVKVANGEYAFPPRCVLELLALEYPTTRKTEWRGEVRVPGVILSASEFIYGRDRVARQKCHNWTNTLLRFALHTSLGWQEKSRFHHGFANCLTVHKDVEPEPWILFEEDLKGAPRHVRWRNASRMLADGWPRKRVKEINSMHWTTVRRLHEEYLATGQLYY